MIVNLMNPLKIYFPLYDYNIMRMACIYWYYLTLFCKLQIHYKFNEMIIFYLNI